MLVDCDLDSLETETRDLIGETTPRGWTEAHTFRCINNEVSRLVRMALESDQAYFQTSKTYTLTSNSVTLPRNCWKPRAVMVYRDSRWYPIWWTHLPELYLWQGALTDEQYAKAVRFEGNTLILEPGYASVSQLKVWYSRVPAPLIKGTASAGAATTMTLASDASIHDDIYIGDEFELMSGTGSGVSAICSDYVGSTKVATFPTWGTNPDATTVYSTILPDPVRKYPSLVAYGAALRALPRRRDTELAQWLKQEYSDEFQLYQAALAPRQSDQPRYAHFIPREDDW